MNYEQRVFLKNFILQPNTIGSITPSSKYLCSSMLKNINFEGCNTIVEYGAGTGIFTKEIIKRKRNDTLFISFEINDELFDKIKKLHAPQNNIYIIKDSAENLSLYLNKLGKHEVDNVISGLPFAVLPVEKSKAIIKNTFEVLKVGGEFTTFQYSLQFLKTIKKYSSKVKMGIQLFNIPPAFIYYCNK